MLCRKFGFTLAEVLITLGIIGIVAAMTLPPLVQKQQEKVTVARVKKAYSILQQAFMMAVQKDGPPDLWGVTEMYEPESHIITARKFMPYIKVLTDCTGMKSHEVYKKCTKSFSDNASYASFRIADGTTVIVRQWNGKCNGRYGNTKGLKNVCGQIMIDTNGTGRPDYLGQDIYSFYLTKQGLYPSGTEFDRISIKTHCKRSVAWNQIIDSYANGMGCTAWVLYNENMNYLHCDVDWENDKKSCRK